jgi:hypothetical protein
MMTLTAACIITWLHDAQARKVPSPLLSFSKSQTSKCVDFMQRARPQLASMHAFHCSALIMLFIPCQRQACMFFIVYSLYFTLTPLQYFNLLLQSFCLIFYFFVFLESNVHNYFVLVFKSILKKIWIFLFYFKLNFFSIFMFF